MELDELREKVKSGEIVGAHLNSPINGLLRLRFFISTTGELGYIAKGRRRRGYTVQPANLALVKSFILRPAPVDSDLARYHIIQKYRKMAMAATFDNSFIRHCKALPTTFEQWVADGKKHLSDYHITTGTQIDGKVISVKSLAAAFSPSEIEQFRNAMKTGQKYRAFRRRFRGYDGTIEVYPDVEGINVTACLSLEFKGCGNGYYYLLINDENFIGYDVD